jgi:hypothetical protein
MKKSLFFALVCAGALSLCSCGGDEPKNGGGEWTPPVIENPNKIELENAGFENGLEGWTIKNFSNGSKTVVEIVDGEGRSESKAAKIQQWPENGKCCVALERKLTGLEPDVLYRATVSMRYSDLNDGCGAILFAGDDRQHWNSSKFTSGTKLENWTTASFDFLSDDNGEALVYLALGFKWDSYPNIGGRSTGTVFYDNFSVVKVTSEMFSRESEHIRFYCYPSKVTTSGANVEKWLKEVDGMYEAYAELVGAVPHQGRKLTILTTQGMYSGYWALAGYPILWGANTQAPEQHFNELAEKGTISFGLMHEIGHVFNVNYNFNGQQYYSNWNWNDEMFANFRMHYGLEKVGAKVYMTANGASAARLYTGAEILDMYKADYEQTLPTGKFNDNAIHYLLANLTNSIGWEPFKRTFHEITKKSCPYSNKYDKFKYFVNTLSKHASDVHGTSYDILNDMISDTERKAVENQLK